MISPSALFKACLARPEDAPCLEREVILHGIGQWKGRTSLNVSLSGVIIEIELGKRRMINQVAYEIYLSAPDLRMTVLREIAV